MQRGFFLVVLIVSAGIISLELGVSTALVEILFGVAARNIIPLFGLDWEYLILGGEWLNFLADLGLMAIMFMAGFETDMDLLKENWKSSLIVGMPSFFAPFLTVCVVVFLFCGQNTEKAVLIGIALSTTSLALVFSYLRERQLHNQKLGQLLITCAMVIDLISIFMLTIFFVPLNVSFLAEIGILAVLFIVAPFLGKHLLDRYCGSPNEFGMRFVFFILLGFTFFASHTHLHKALIGFALGIILGRLLREHHQLVDKLSGVIFSFFAPVFFFFAGSQIVLSAMMPIDWAKALLLLVTAAGMKYFGTLIPLRHIIMPRAARFTGILFNYRLAFGIVSAVFGYSNGIIGLTEYNIILLVVILTTFLPTIFYRNIPREIAIERSAV
ncbi:cation:proton antiporter [bacterium]|nr:cation:proton antiporter [bacterium]